MEFKIQKYFTSWTRMGTEGKECYISAEFVSQLDYCSVSYAEFKHGLLDLGADFSEHDINMLCYAADRDGGGDISLEEMNQELDAARGTSVAKQSSRVGPSSTSMWAGVKYHMPRGNESFSLLGKYVGTV